MGQIAGDAIPGDTIPGNRIPGNKFPGLGGRANDYSAGGCVRAGIERAKFREKPSPPGPYVEGVSNDRGE